MSLSELHLESLWPPILLGLLAIYILLPRPNPFPSASGIVAALAALVIGALTVVPEATRSSVVEAILFYSFAAIALLGGLTLVTQTNPARGAVAFALVVLATCGLYLLQAAPFLMAGTIIIYAGAIVVTFLFVIMLAHQHGPSNADERSREPLLSCLAGGLLLAVMLMVLRQHYDDSGVARVVFAASDLAISKTTDLRELREATSRLQPNADTTTIIREFEAIEPKLSNQSLTRDETAVAVATFARRVDGIRRHLGAMPPDSKVLLSPFAGTPPNKRISPLPAANVVGLGRTLYSDHLLGVELAGTLLLVATIGAIAITNRQPARRAA